MTATYPTGTLRAVALDLYRDIHKGIRTELFDVTAEAGRVDPGDRGARLALAHRVDDLVELLVTHAEHEDGAIQPALEAHLPALAERVEVDHLALEARLGDLAAWARDAADAPKATRRQHGHGVYLELASFTGAYLEHQDVEERVVMPALEDAIGVEAVGAIHGAILASIPPQQMATSLALMLPAMNVEDRTELLGGMQAGAPAEVFAGVWALAGSVLPSPDVAALAPRLGLA